MSQTALILGAHGRFGRNAALAFAGAGWHVRRFDRARDDLMQAAQTADVIVNGWNPSYDKWQTQVPGLHAKVQQAAKAAGATVILPGNVYVFGPDAPTPWTAETPHQPQTRLGRIRAEMEAGYRRANVRTIVLRAGDFLDTEASGNWFDQVMAKRIARTRFSYPGDFDAPHAWAYLPDLCRAAVQLAEMRDKLPVFTDVPFPGYTLSARDIVGLLTDIAGAPVRLTNMAWWPIALARPVWPMARHLLEMRYLWSLPHALDGTAFHDLCPDAVQTPLDEVLRAAIRPMMSAEMTAKPAAVGA